MNRVGVALARLESIRSISTRPVEGSGASILIERYLENTVGFAERFGCGQGGAFFFDAAEIVAPGRIQLSEGEEATINRLPGWFSPFISNMCRSYLKWSKFGDEAQGSYSPFLDLYDPIIMLMERGVFIWGVRQGELMVGEEDYRFSLKAWAARFSGAR